MIYWIENAKDGSFVASAGTYEKALIIQDKKWRERRDAWYFTRHFNKRRGTGHY